MANPLISKLKLADGTVVDLKDADGRSNFATLLGSNTLAALKTAAWKDYQATWAASTSEEQGQLPTVGAVKSYVDSQIESIPTFECVVCEAVASKIPAGAKYYDKSTTPATEITGTMAASADTYKKIYLVKNDNAGAGAYIEYLTIRSGSAGSYSYSWEQIGTTVIDLSAYLKTSDAEAWTVAGTAFGTGHAVAASDIKTALSLGALADKDSASGTVTYDKVSAITMNAVDVSGNATVGYTSTAATLTKGAFKPSGTVSGSTTAAGTVSVVLADASTAATVSYSSYKPEGTIAPAESDGSFTALKTAAFSAATSTTGVQITGSVAAPSVNLTFTGIQVYNGIESAAVAPTFSEGKFTAATWSGSSYTAPTWTGSSYTAPTLGNATSAAFANEGIMASVNTSASEGAEDYEMLVFTSATTSNAVTAQGTFSAGSLNFGTFGAGSLAFGTFDGGSKASDTFTAGSAATFTTATVVPSDISASATAPAFTGGYFSVTTTEDTALKNVVFTGSEKANALVTSVTYNKPGVSSATFTGSSADITATFSGTEVSDALVTGVSYDKANASAAFSVSVTPTVSNIAFSSATTSVTVS